MKRIILVISSFLLIVISSSARINPEDYENLRFDSVWWEGPTYRHYTKIMHMVITNVGSKKIFGSLWTAD